MTTALRVLSAHLQLISNISAEARQIGGTKWRCLRVPDVPGHGPPVSVELRGGRWKGDHGGCLGPGSGVHKCVLVAYNNWQGFGHSILEEGGRFVSIGVRMQVWT